MENVFANGHDYLHISTIYVSNKFDVAIERSSVGKMLN